MDTLYDLLGALPHDNAEGLRTAFRRSVKGTHPDLRPGDPEAALRFRQIVRANEILSDSEQRAAYDHLLALARLEKDPASAHPIAARIHRVASGVIAFVGASIVMAGGYLLFMHMSMALVTPGNNSDVATRTPANFGAAGPMESSRQAEASASIAKFDSINPGETIIPRAVPVIRVENIPAFNISPALNISAPADPAANEAWFFRARGISAYRKGDLNGAIIDLDQAILLDPKSSASYIDRGIVFYRMRKYDRAFADIARAKRIEKQGGPKSVPGMPKKLHLDQTAIALPEKPKPKPPTPAAPPSFNGLASATFQ